MAYAHVPKIPGPIVAIAGGIDKKDNFELGGEWHACGDMVTEDWYFDGRSFTPPAPKPQIEQG